MYHNLATVHRPAAATSEQPHTTIPHTQSPGEDFRIIDIRTALDDHDKRTQNPFRSILTLVVYGEQPAKIVLTGIKTSLPTMQEEYNTSGGDLQWLISANTLTFGGLLLLAGVLSDRYGRKDIFYADMVWMSIWTISCGFATSFI